MHFPRFSLLLLWLLVIVVSLPRAEAFGAGNIASIAKIEGSNWRHGDIEDTLKAVAHLKGWKWNGANIKRVYFGNWLRDYSQAVDVGTLKSGTSSDTIRLLLSILAFMTFGYATREYEVTSDRLGVYRAEEHIDNPKNYADGEDARKYDPRLRGPVLPEELSIDIQSGMKNYIANERGNWSTSIGYVKYSLTRSIHFGRLFKHGGGSQDDLFEAFRCLGQALHTCEDFSAHSNYIELSLIELGHYNVFPHVGVNTMINLRGKQVYPLVTGTFGGVDFLHSVLGEASDHVAQSETQSEVQEMQKALSDASGSATRGNPGTEQQASGLIELLSKVPGTSGICQEARSLQRDSQAQAISNQDQGDPSRAGLPFGMGSNSSSAQSINPQAIYAKIYPIMVFRDNVMRTISSIVSHIPGLESLIDKISEKITLFVMSLLSPYILPVIRIASTQLKTGSSTVINASAQHQYQVFSDPNCTDPTHSMLSKDHFSNILNEPAGQVASCVLKHVVPLIVEAWEQPNLPLEQVLNNAVGHIFHHPAARSEKIEIQRRMFEVVQKWTQSMPDRGAKLDKVLSSESVKNGGNHKGGNPHMHVPGMQDAPSMASAIPSGFGTQSGYRGVDPSDQQSPQLGENFQQQNQAPYMSHQHQQHPSDGFSYNQGVAGMNSNASYYAPPPPGQADNAQYPPFAAAPRPNDPDAYPTAYQQGYEIPLHDQYDQQQAGYSHQGGAAQYGMPQGYGGQQYDQTQGQNQGWNGGYDQRQGHDQGQGQDQYQQGQVWRGQGW